MKSFDDKQVSVLRYALMSAKAVWEREAREYEKAAEMTSETSELAAEFRHYVTEAEKLLDIIESD